MSLKAVLAKPTALKDLIDAMKDLVKDVNFDVNESGLQVQCTDSSNVGLVHLKMHEAAFESFKCTKAMTIGVNAESFAKILKLCGPTDKLTLETEHDSNTLKFMFESAQENRVAKFEMKTVVVEQDTLGCPDTDFQAVINMPSGEFKKAVSELKDIGDNMILSASEEGLRLAVDGEMGGKRHAASRPRGKLG
jgi:proliferating cell nuclear antigen